MPSVDVDGVKDVDGASSPEQRTAHARSPMAASPSVVLALPMGDDRDDRDDRDGRDATTPVLTPVATLLDLPSDLLVRLVDLDDPLASISALRACNRAFKTLFEDDASWRGVCAMLGYTRADRPKRSIDLSWESHFHTWIRLRLDNTSLRSALRAKGSRRTHFTLDGALTPLADLGCIGAWDVSKVTDMSWLFLCDYKFDEDIGQWDVRRVTNVEGMFQSADSFNQDLTAWANQLGRVTNMTSMFAGAIAFEGVGLSEWNVSNVVDMTGMFDAALEFDQDLSGWACQVGHVKSFGAMFRDARRFQGRGLEKWDVSGAVIMCAMFKSATRFKADIGSWTICRAEDTSHMFETATLFDADLSGWGAHFGNVKRMNGMFAHASSFKGVGVSTWDVRKVTHMESVFKCATQFDCDLSTWGHQLENVIVMCAAFHGATQFRGRGLSTWQLPNVRQTRRMRRDARQRAAHLALFGNFGSSQ